MFSLNFSVSIDDWQSDGASAVRDARDAQVSPPPSHCLVVGFSPSPLKNDGVSSSVGMMFSSQFIWKVIKAHGSKPLEPVFVGL